MKLNFSALTLETITRIIRLETFLEDITLLERNENNKLTIDSFLSRVDIAKRKILESINDINNIYSNNKDLNQNMDSEDIGSLIKSIIIPYNTVWKTCQDLIFLCSPNVRPETYIFINELLSLDNNHKFIPISLAPAYNFFKRDIQSQIIKENNNQIENKKCIIILLPSILYKAPITWGILLHELGHIIENEKDIINTFMDNYKNQISEEDWNLKKIDITTNWMRELFSDLYAIELLGPAYFIYFINYSILKENINLSTPDHPSSKYRINIMYNRLIEKNIKHKIVKFYYDFFNWRLNYKPSIKKSTEIDVESYLTPNEIKDHLVIIINEITKDMNISIKLSRCELLAKKVNENIIISSRKQFTEKNLCKKIDKKPLIERTDVEKLMNDFIDIPNDMYDIYNAMWFEYHFNGLKKIFEKLFFSKELNHKEFIKNYNEFKKYIIKNDMLMLKSIETSRLHKIYLNLDKDNNGSKRN